MPSTRRQKAKARRSREMDILSDYDNLDVMLGNENKTPAEERDIFRPELFYNYINLRLKNN